jgi:RNA polymerase sigma-70 factor (ECF subfamily)
MPGRRLTTGHSSADGDPSGESPTPLAPTFQRIYDERFEDVERWVRALGGRPSDVPDLVQDVFVVAYRRLPYFEVHNVAGWLYRITRRKMRDYRRLSWIKHLFTPRTLSTFKHSLAVGTDPLKQLETHERTELLERVLNTLPSEQRAAFVLFELEGYSGAAIAELQQVPINTVWGRIYKARRKLQSQLDAFQQPGKRALRK